MFSFEIDLPSGCELMCFFSINMDRNVRILMHLTDVVLHKLVHETPWNFMLDIQILFQEWHALNNLIFEVSETNVA
jgi:hypothetical protein